MTIQDFKSSEKPIAKAERAAVADQQKAESTLQFQAQLLDSVRQAIVAIDLNGRITYWGKGATRLFLYTGDEVLGRDVREVLKSPHRQDPADLANMWKTLRAKESDWEITEVLNRKDGRQIHVQILASPIFDEAGEVCSAVGLHRDISELVANQQLLRDSKEQMRNLVARLIDIREDERSAIAREVHDELGQMLTRMKMDLHRLRGMVSGSDAEAMADSIVMIVDVMLNSVRAICSRLGPPILKDLGLEEAIDWIGNQFADWCVWDVDIDLKLRSLPRNHDRDFALFRIVQEALTNSARHASASRVWIRGRRDKKSIVLEIEDNGVGISPTAMSRPMSLGLGGMRERAAKIGGKLDTLTMSGGGTTIRVCAPVELADGARREE